MYDFLAVLIKGIIELKQKVKERGFLILFYFLFVWWFELECPLQDRVLEIQKTCFPVGSEASLEEVCHWVWVWIL